MPKMQTSFNGLVQLLAKHLYPEPDVFIRELIQNAHDSIRFRQVTEPQLQGVIEVYTDSTALTISFIDNGKGMDKQGIEDFLSTIGQFGIGLLSAFVVAEQIDVYTWRTGSDQAWHWSNRGGEEYELKEIPAASIPTGTKVVVRISSDHRSHIEEEKVRKTIKKYADFIPFNIMLNGNGPVNVKDAPWHRSAWANEREYRQALSRFLNDRYPDSPLHIIPIRSKSPQAYGALYISDRHISVLNTTGVVDIFQERMAIRMKDQEILPEWAKFIYGIIDSPDLHPTAARDNVIKDDVYFRLRKVMGDLIIQSIMELSKTDKSKFFRICKWHHYHLKGMARHHEEFFDAVIDHLPFETNKGDMTLKEYVSRQSYEPGERVPVYYFSFGYDSNQFYELCDARGLLTINTGKTHDETLVRRYVERYPETLELKQMDHLDDPGLFQRLTEEEHRPFFPLENALRRAMERVGITRVKPVTRRFRPSTMSAAIIATQRIEAYDKMQALLEQPFMIEGLGELAQEVAENLSKTPLDLFLNSDNEIVQMLAKLDKIEAPNYQNILLNVYNSAILYSQHRMTPESAKIFYHQMQQMMLASLKLETELDKVRKEKEELLFREFERNQTKAITTSHREWIRLFVMMPYQSEYDRIEEALREILESSPYFFELQLARSRHMEDTVKANIQTHILNADGYIADISTHSPNIMMELGWIYFEPDLEKRLTLVLRADDGKEHPVDIAGKLSIGYPSPNSENLKEHLQGIFENHEHLQNLADHVKQRQRKRFLSPCLFKSFDLLSDKERLKTLCKAFKTIEEVLDADKDLFRRRVADAGDEKLHFLWDAIQDHLKNL